ncbi:MAG TPA: hypothetical protein VM580_10245, partial [Labilithrix sp.]|nr:hypothetical protein [Labilithrix sp.]
MPFLCVFRKKTSEVELDTSRLQHLLCPYQGQVERVTVPRGLLYLSSICSTTESICLIPRGTNKSPSTAWLEISVDDRGVSFETDPLGTFPLWWFEDDTHLVVTSEVKSLRAFHESRLELDLAALTPVRRAPNFSPYQHIRRVHDVGIPEQVVHLDAESPCKKRTKLACPARALDERLQIVDARDLH